MSDPLLSTKPQSRLTNVHDVALKDGVISWSHSDGADQVKLEQLLFVLDLPPSLKGRDEYIICFLREHLDNREDAFRLLLLSTAKIPEQLHQRYRINALPSHLTHTDDNAVDIVVSTKSGVGHALNFWQSVLQPLWTLIDKELPSTASVASRRTPNVLITQDAQSVREFARQLHLGASTSESSDQTPKSRTIVLLSGDGGVVDLSNGGPSDTQQPQQQRPLLALLPLGTGNALFQSLHKPVWTGEHGEQPSPLVLGLRTLFNGVAADLPVFRATFSSGSHIVNFTPDKTSSSAELSRQETEASHLYGAVVASYGFHASIVYESDTPEYRVHGNKRFGMVAQELLRESHPYTAHVEIRRPLSAQFETLKGDAHAYVLMTLTSNLERLFTISPASKPLDGKLRLVHFGPVGAERTMDVMMKAYDEGKHIDMKWDDGHQVTYEEVEEVRVTILENDERWRKVCIDGTIVDIPKGGQLSVTKEDKGAFQVLVDSRVVPGN